MLPKVSVQLARGGEAAAAVAAAGAAGAGAAAWGGDDGGDDDDAASVDASGRRGRANGDGTRADASSTTAAAPSSAAAAGASETATIAAIPNRMLGIEERVRAQRKDAAAAAAEGRAGGGDADGDRLREEVARLPEGVAYSVPIADFGAAMLRGMGWTKGQAFGRYGGDVVEPIEYIPRHHRLGLGAAPRAPDEAAAARADETPAERKAREATEGGRKRKQRAERTYYGLAPTQDGRVRHYRTLDEQLVPLAAPGAQAVVRFDPGDAVRVVGGRHDGIAGVVAAVGREGGGSSGSSSGGGSGERRRRRLYDVRLRNGEVLRGIVEDYVVAPKSSSGNGNGKKARTSAGAAGAAADGGAAAGAAGAGAGAGGRSSSSSSARPSWLFTGIRVRVVDRRRHEALYNKKGTVVDVPEPRVAMVLVEDGGGAVVRLPQGALETVLPKGVGGLVRVVGGRYRGRSGTLLERRVGGRQEAAVGGLCDDDDDDGGGGDGRVVNVHYDHIAADVGTATDD